jgi:regulator of RNase E activity RraA
MLEDQIIKIASEYDTPTICNAMDIILGTRTAVGFTKKSIVVAENSSRSIVGFAKTAKIRAASPPIISQEEVFNNRMEYYEYLVKDTMHPVVVIEDTDYPNTVGAFWGELNVAVHKGLKVKGTVTNGLIRDLDMLDPGYQVIAGGIGPSHAFVHITSIDTDINIFGLEVSPNDFVHADRHGAMVVPKKHLTALPDAIKLVTEKEIPILKAARKEGFNIEKLKEAFEESKKIR